VEIECTVNAVGLVGAGGKCYAIGNALPGLRVTLRLDGTVMHVLDRGRALLATLPCPVTPSGLGWLQGPHQARPPPTAPTPSPVTAERIVSAQGTFMVARQKITVGKQHAHAVVQVAVDGGVIQVFHNAALIHITHQRQYPDPTQIQREPRPAERTRSDVGRAPASGTQSSRQVGTTSKTDDHR
jgi:hypothetical protein